MPTGILRKWRELMSRPSLDRGTDLLCTTIAYVSSASITAALRVMFTG
jgi:hypothetical protein